MASKELLQDRAYGTFSQEIDELHANGSDKVPSNVGYDDVLLEIGEFGSWQQWLALIFWIPPAVSGAIFMMGTFTS